MPACDWAMSLLSEVTSIKQSTCVFWALQAKLTKDSLLSPFSRTSPLTIVAELYFASTDQVQQTWVSGEQLMVP